MVSNLGAHLVGCSGAAEVLGDAPWRPPGSPKDFLGEVSEFEAKFVGGLGSLEGRLGALEGPGGCQGARELIE